MRLRAQNTFIVEPWLPQSLEPLREIAHDLSWTWNTEAIGLFSRIGGERWTATVHNPVRLLQLMPRDELAALGDDPRVIEEVTRLAEQRRTYLSRAPQLMPAHTSTTAVIAYFSLEFALTESFATYSGGLGVLAGDHLRSASDLGLPLVGVGLLYREGYFQQVFTPEGWQTEEYHELDPAHHPVSLVRDDAGEVLTVSVPFAGRDVLVQIWRVNVGHVALYLLDSDIPANSEGDRKIAARLYGGDNATRIQQEMLLGIGGIRALRALGLRPAVCHMNEGHSSLLAVERISELMAERSATFEEARLAVAAGTVFTTHTAVAAGIDLFAPELVRTELGHYYTALGLDERTFLGLGRMDPEDAEERFSMALLGLKLSGFRNGVSKLHRSVSRWLWEGAWPSLPASEIPIDSVTNGVHLPTWVAHGTGRLYDRYVGAAWRDDPLTSARWDGVAEIPAGELWRCHEDQRHSLIERAQRQHRESDIRRGASDGAEGLDPGTLTIGFARRFAAYKRASLLFRDPERLARIVNNPDRPIQFIFAGKAHPREEGAKHLIQEVITHTRDAAFRGRLVVLERYDMDLARVLVQGCDVWLNTPLRPLEASGTSGMKAVANGALHLSVLDGWWAEAFQHGAGWSIGRPDAGGEAEMQDAFDADSLYDLLEFEVAPAFYERDHDGLPHAWIAAMRKSMAAFSPQFSTHRMVSEYAARAYGPAATGWTRLTSDGMAPARELGAWLAHIAERWPQVRIARVEDEARATGDGLEVEIRVSIELGGLSRTDLRVDVVAGPASPDQELDAQESLQLTPQAGSEGPATFFGTFKTAAPGRVGYAIRVLPRHADLGNARDTGLVLWS